MTKLPFASGPGFAACFSSANAEPDEIPTTKMESRQHAQSDRNREFNDMARGTPLKELGCFPRMSKQDIRSRPHCTDGTGSNQLWRRPKSFANCGPTSPKSGLSRSTVEYESRTNRSAIGESAVTHPDFGEIGPQLAELGAVELLNLRTFFYVSFSFQQFSCRTSARIQ